MLNVFLTVNTEPVCDYLVPDDLQFANLFQQYVYGPTRNGNCALPFLLDIMDDYGLTSSFFVESLFALKYGLTPLQDIVSLIARSGQQIQLMLNPEWASCAHVRLFDGEIIQSSSLSDFTLEQQSTLIRVAVELLKSAGSDQLNAFRAVNYSINKNSLTALIENRLIIDCSYNEVRNTDISLEQVLLQPTQLNGVFIYPVSAYYGDAKQKLRALELTQCSSLEFETVLLHAVENQWDSVVIVLQSTDLMTSDQERLDRIVYRRFIKLCEFLSNSPDLFNVTGFNGLEPKAIAGQFDAPTPRAFDRSLRIGEQVLRRVI